MDAYCESEGFDTIGFEESVWVRPRATNTRRTFICQLTLQLTVESPTLMAEFMAHMLDRFIGTDEDFLNKQPQFAPCADAVCMYNARNSLLRALHVTHVLRLDA